MEKRRQNFPPHSRPEGNVIKTMDFGQKLIKTMNYRTRAKASTMTGVFLTIGMFLLQTSSSVEW